jgi:hypothetical protein
MPIRRSILMLLFAAAIAANAGAAAADEAAAVRRSFDGLKAALLGDRGPEAARLLSRSTLAAAEEARDLALYAGKAELEAQPTALLLAALSLRGNVDARRLRAMSGADVAAHAVSADLTRDSAVASLQPAAIRAGPAVALVELASDRALPVSQLRFRKEDGLWKLDLAETARGDTALDRLARSLAAGNEAARRAMRNEMILALLAASSGVPADSSIWQPPLRRP